jgi:hypothetical protein
MEKKVNEMNLRKILFLIVFIVATLIIISGVSAEDISSVSSAEAASALPLPELQFNHSQENVVVPEN